MIESVSTKEFGAFTKENIVVDSNSLEEEVYTTKKTNWKLFKDGFKSKEGFKSFIFLDSSTSFANEDLLPVSSEKKHGNGTAFLLIGSVNLGRYQHGLLDLPWWQVV